MSDSPSIDLIRPPELATRAEYAYAAIARGMTRLIFTAGACPLDESGAVVAAGDFVGQTEQVMTNLVLALNACDACLRDVVKTTVYVASSERDDLLSVWQVVSRCFGEHDAPSTLVGVTVLGYRGQLVEVEAIAALP